MAFNFFEDIASDVPDAVFRISADTTIAADDFIRGEVYVSADLSGGDVTTTFPVGMPDGSIIGAGVYLEEGTNRHTLFVGNGAAEKFADRDGNPDADGGTYFDIEGEAYFKKDGALWEQYTHDPTGSSVDENTFTEITDATTTLEAGNYWVGNLTGALDIGSDTIEDGESIRIIDPLGITSNFPVTLSFVGRTYSVEGGVGTNAVGSYVIGSSGSDVTLVRSGVNFYLDVDDKETEDATLPFIDVTSNTLSPEVGNFYDFTPTVNNNSVLISASASREDKYFWIKNSGSFNLAMIPAPGSSLTGNLELGNSTVRPGETALVTHTSATSAHVQVVSSEATTEIQEVLTVVAQNSINDLAQTPIGNVKFFIRGVLTSGITNSAKSVTVNPALLEYNLSTRDEVKAIYQSQL